MTILAAGWSQVTTTWSVVIGAIGAVVAMVLGVITFLRGQTNAEKASRARQRANDFANGFEKAIAEMDALRKITMEERTFMAARVAQLRNVEDAQ